MAHKHLHELICEDQEPFVLQNYIEEKRCQLKRSVTRDHLQVKRRKPISGNSTFPASFCKNACFFSFHDSPDLRKSPLFDFSSPLRSPCGGTSNKLFVHIPSRTAALLLEAALRIQKQPSSSKPQATGKNLCSGFFGSILKRINLCKRNQSPQIKGNKMRVSVKDILRWDSSDGRKAFAMEKRQDQEKRETLEGNRAVSEMGLSCSCNSRVSSIWSESNEDKSEDLETSSSRSDDEAFCSSPFRFSLRNSPSDGQRTPEFGSPATSPRCHIKEVKHKEEGSEGGRQSCVRKKEYENKEKEQCSPVCVLDQPFDTDVDDDDNEGDNNNNNSDDGDHRHHQSDSDLEESEGEELNMDDHNHRRFEEEEEEEHSYDDDDALERSFAIVQRPKQQLLHKLRRFERLVDLNPIELEKRMLEVDDEEEEEECDDEEAENNKDTFVESVYGRFKEGKGKGKEKTTGDMKRLILDLITEEGRRRRNEDNIDGIDKEVVINNVSKRFEAWNEVESDTIDMMVDLELRREGEEWKRCQEQVSEMAIEIEFAILGLLLQELFDEVVCS
ncbi:RNA polymerase-associated protein LEO1-like [Telopea speciosissima]|uniref:RNA polymerase-associated protein LEO1-like n=1 Tax=Telopea speciosissima TaxID=54955 RepID=UPI001CC6E47A|nr:RNA polymerase-associated protein LEO1-like [Telopea speciosissima]